LEDFHLIDQDTTNIVLGGYPGYRLIYLATSNEGTPIKQLEIGAKVEGKVYYLIYSAERQKYQDYLPDIQEMINSFDLRSSKAN
jgi:hypothetical protein